MKRALPKAEIFRRMERFSRDKNKALSWKHFGELCGVDPAHLREIFVSKSEILTEYVQIRVSRALERLEQGDVTVMVNRDQTRFLQYNNTPRPRLVKTGRILFQDGEIRVQNAITNANDYSHPTLDEQLGEGHAGSKKL